MYENTSFSRNFLFPFSYWGERYHLHFEFLDFSRIRKVWNLWLYPGTERNTAYKTKKKNWKTLLCAVSGRNCCKRSRSKGIFMFQSEYFPISPLFTVITRKIKDRFYERPQNQIILLIRAKFSRNFLFASLQMMASKTRIWNKRKNQFERWQSKYSISFTNRKYLAYSFRKIRVSFCFQASS